MLKNILSRAARILCFPCIMAVIYLMKEGRDDYKFAGVIVTLTTVVVVAYIANMLYQKLSNR